MEPQIKDITPEAEVEMRAAAAAGLEVWVVLRAQRDRVDKVFIQI
jgi:hypothetical protein